MKLQAIPAPLGIQTDAPAGELPVLAALPVPTTNDHDPDASAALAEAFALGVARIREAAIGRVARGPR